MEDKRRRKHFGYCSRRHQRRIIHQDIGRVLQLINNRQENLCNNDASNISSSVYIGNEAKRVCIKNDELRRNVEMDFDRHHQICFQFLKDDHTHDSNMQLLDFRNSQYRRKY